jgi:UDP-glucose 4-epimerase
MERAGSTPPERVLVTGGTGVIGAWVVRAFVQQGITPIVFVRGSTDHIGRTINGDVDDALIWAYGDLLDPLTLMRAVEAHRADAIVHLASAKPWQVEAPFVVEPKTRQALEQIVTATANVLEVARIVGIRRVVYGSSKAVYDDVAGPQGPPAYQPLNEDYPCLPHTLYGVGKVAAERLGSYYADQFGIEFLAVRFSSSFGPLKRGTPASPDGMVQAAAEGRTVQIRRFPDGVRDDFVYNKDVAKGIVRATLAAPPRHRAFNLGTGQGVTHEDIASAILRVVPEAPIEFIPPDLPMPGLEIIDRAKCVFDISRAREELGYEPRFVPLDVAFADMLEEDARMKQTQRV